MPRPAKGPRLEQNKQGIFEVRWRENGKPRSRSTGARTMQEAGEFLSSWTEQAIIKAGPGSGKTKISHILQAYWEAWAQDTISAETTKSNIKLLKDTLGFIDANELSALDIQSYCRKRRKGQIGIRPVGDGTIRRELTILTAAINHAIEAKVLKRDEAPTIALPPQPPPRERYLELEEIELLLATARSMREGDRLSRLERFLALAIHTGARKEAIIQLPWDRVDFDKRLIDFRDPRLTITKKRRATVPISDALLPILQQAFAERRGALVLDTTGPIRSVFERAAARAGLEDVTPHTLRHTWATHASMNGVALNEIARVLGNTVGVVERVYAKFQPGYLAKAVNSAYGGRSFAEERAV